MDGEDLATLKAAMACYPLRVLHPAGVVALRGAAPQGLSAAACETLFPHNGAGNSDDAAPRRRDAHSPFRFVADKRLHDSLVDAQRDTCCHPMWRAVDYQCHRQGGRGGGGGGTRAAISSPTADMGILPTSSTQPPQAAAPPSTTSRKRTREATADDGAQSYSLTDVSDIHGYDALASRVDDNDDLLRVLLNEEVIASSSRPAPTAIVSDVPRINSDPAGAPELLSPSSTGPMPTTSATPALSACRVAELKARCAARGLLTTGNKDVLIRRLTQHENMGARTQTAPTTATTRIEPTATVKATIPVRTASGSPPRTIFRYCSSPSLSTTSLSPARPATEAENHPTSAPASSPQRRRVPAFDAFITALAESSGSPTTTTTTATSASSSASDKRLAKAQEAATQAAMARLKWRVLVDHRERVKGKNEHMLSALRRQHVECAPCVLPCGDFVISVAHEETNGDMANERVREPVHAPLSQDGVADDYENGDDGEDAARGTTAASLDAQAEDANSTTAALSHVFTIVVERKTADDLDASIKGSRYLEQRRLLSLSPFTHVVWLIEGEPRSFPRFAHGARGGSHWKNRGASRSPTPPPPQPASQRTADAGAEEAGADADAGGGSGKAVLGLRECEQRLDAACASLATTLSASGKGFTVVRTRDVHESVAFLKQLAQVYVREAAVRRDGTIALHTNANTDATHATAPLFAHVRQLQRHLRAQTAFPRALMCVRGCSSSLALWIVRKYGTLLGLWRLVHTRGRDAVDGDVEVRLLPTTQKKVLILLTEFLLATEYF